MNIGFIGGGKMGEAILAALLKAGRAASGDILVVEKDAARLDVLERTYGIVKAADPAALAGACHTVILAVKPQDLDATADSLAPAAGAGHLVISIAAGKRIAAIERRLPAARIVRVMPNVAALAGCSANVFCLGSRATDADRETVRGLLSSFGQAVEIAETHFDTVTALSGSGPAFFAYFAACMAQAASALGLAEPTARALSLQTMLGAARLLAEDRFTPETLIQAVSSPNGTTVAGRAVLEDGRLASIVNATLKAAAERGRELAG
jgi:pyrroline-5-carboxylate reductase